MNMTRQRRVLTFIATFYFRTNDYLLLGEVILSVNAWTIYVQLCDQRTTNGIYTAKANMLHGVLAALSRAPEVRFRTLSSCDQTRLVHCCSLASSPVSQTPLLNEAMVACGQPG